MSIDRVVGLIDRRTIRNLSNDWQVRNYGACFLFGKKNRCVRLFQVAKVGSIWRVAARDSRTT